MSRPVIAKLNSQLLGNCLKNARDGFLFVFEGGSPGWQEAGGQPTVETEILVSRDGASIVDVVYNGSPR